MFEETLRLYAGAREMAASASSGTKKVYEDKADGFLKTLVAWLRTNMLTSYEVIHQGVPKKMVELLIVLASLVQNGNITLSVAGEKLDAANLVDATKMTLDQLVSFKHIEKPKGLPLAELVALFELLGLAEELIRNENTHDEAVKQLRSKSNDLTEKVVTVAQHVQTGLPCWGSELIPAEDREHYRQKLDELKAFLEGLQAFNTPGKLKNFTKSILEIQAHSTALDIIKQIEELNGLVQELTALTGYLGTAAAVLPPQDPWRAQMETMRSEWRAKLIYTAHSYHTKVPHKSIRRAILHYTSPGDVVLDGFAGSGMTGVAAQMCGHPDQQFKAQVEDECKEEERTLPEWGVRRVVLNDLSPAATFIERGYNLPFDVSRFEEGGELLLKNVEDELRWMYETIHSDGKTKGRITFTVWSENFACPECGKEFVFHHEALDQKSNKIRDVFPCPKCQAELTKDTLQRVMGAGNANSLRRRIPPLDAERVLSLAKSDRRRKRLAAIRSGRLSCRFDQAC